MIQKIHEKPRTESEGQKSVPSFCIDSNSPIFQRLLQLGYKRRDNNAEFLVVTPQSSECMPRADLNNLNSILDKKAGADTKHLIMVSSALIYDATHTNPGLMRETQRLPLNPSEVSSSWIQAEELVAKFAESKALGVTILRAATVVNKTSGRQLPFVNGSFFVSASGRDPVLQLLSLQELAICIAKVIDGPREGVFNLAPSDAISIRNICKKLKRIRIPIPYWILSLIGKDQDHLNFCWTVCSQKFEETFGYAPQTNSEEALQTVLNKEVSANAEAISTDPFGADKSYLEKCRRGRFRFCEKLFWRISLRGMENIPEKGGAVLAGTHRGFMPFDGVMLVHLINKQKKRFPRFLIHPSLVKFGHLDGFLKRIGGVIANWDNANWVLENQEVLGVFPEGIRGAFKKYDKDIYELGKFGRNDFVKMAVKHQVPIIPFVTLGPAESFPILHKFNWAWWKRLTGWPCLPITLTWPLLPVPLPTKWHFRILAPIHPREFGVNSVDDREGVKALSNEVGRRMQLALDEARECRRSWFFGNAHPQNVEE